MTLSIYLKGSLPLNQPPRTMIIFYSQPSQVSCDGVSVFRATAIILYLSCQHLKASLLVSKLKLGRPHTLQHIHPTVCPSCGLHFSAFHHFSFSLVLLFLVSSSFLFILCCFFSYKLDSDHLVATHPVPLFFVSLVYSSSEPA